MALKEFIKVVWDKYSTFAAVLGVILLLTGVAMGYASDKQIAVDALRQSNENKEKIKENVNDFKEINSGIQNIDKTVSLLSLGVSHTNEKIDDLKEEIKEIKEKIEEIDG